MPNETPPLVAQAYELFLLVAGVVCLVHFVFFFKGSKKISPQEAIPGWRLSILDFFFGLVVIVSAVLAVQILLNGVIEAGPDNEGDARQLIIFGFATHLTALAVLFAFYKGQTAKFADPIDKSRIGWGESLKISIYAFLAIVPVIFPIALAWRYLLELAGQEPAPQETVLIFAQIDHLPLVVLMVILTVVLAPVSEEILFRGCLYRFLKARLSIVAALLLSGVLFSLLHHNLLGFVPLLILGIALAYAYEKSGSIKVPILLHGIFNLNTVLILIMTGDAL